MNARLIVLLLSFFAATLPTHALSLVTTNAPQQSPIKAKININTADLKTLTGSFKGIGKKRAETIIAYRESHRGFKSLQELAEVKGLGQRFVERNIDKLNEVFIL